MRRFLLAFALSGALAACDNPKPKPDPYLIIRVLNRLDTTTKAGQAYWRVFVLLTGPQANQNGIVSEGTFSLRDARFNHPLRCISVGADSIGQRLIAPFAIGDTVHPNGQPDAVTDSIVERWYGGNHAPAAGFLILTITPTDAWNSAQYAAGHGLVPTDPILWAWDWSGGGTTSFTERAATDTVGGCNKF